MKTLVTLSMLFTSSLFAIERDKAAHFGISYAIATTTYGFSKKAFRLDKTDAIIFSMFATILVTTAVEYMPGNTFDTKDILANGLGATAATATILMFDF